MRKKQAIALRYRSTDPAPRIIAKGMDRIADLIVEIAREHGIHIENDPLLVQTLMGFNVGDYIPDEVYEVVAQILAFVYKLRLGDREYGDEKNTGR
jgi:flagellar biosynthesis protein